MSLRLFALPLLLMLAACAPAMPQGPVVLAAASLQGALDEIADDWAQQGHPRPVLSFAGTPALARQVEAGVPADLFISADEEWMAYLARRGLIAPASEHIIAGNALALVEPVAGAAPGADRFAMADPASVPAGRYGKAALEKLGQWKDVEGRLVPTENVRAALALVERGEVQAGLVYASDAAASSQVRVMATLPADSHPPIRYPMAVLAGSTHPDATSFAEFIASARGQAILQSHGFRPAE